MKILRYLLISFAIVMASVQIVNAKAQNLAQQPATEFHSTSSMVGSGSTLPQAAVEGTATTYDTNEGAERTRGGNIRKDGRPGDWTNPYDDPIGDGTIALALLACVYVLLRYVRMRKRAEQMME